MKTFLQSFLLLFFVSGSYAQNLEWAAQVGGIDRDQGNSIAVDDSGNVTSQDHTRVSLILILDQIRCLQQPKDPMIFLF
ncbi:MAG: SBBP repeat-containing protein [Bacteroidetes bacterium]|nr:SBBP repeat-containing protein [Bacteroidota bacterium]